MLIFDGDCVINFNNIEGVYVLPYVDSSVQLRFNNNYILKFGSRAEAEFTLADIVDAYEQGKTVYRVVRGRTA